MKKIFQFIMLFAMAMVFANCGGNSNKDKEIEIQDVDEFLSEVRRYDMDKVEQYAREAVKREDFEAAHKCIERIKSQRSIWVKQAWNLAADVYAEETKFLLSNDPDNAVTKIRLLLADITPTEGKPTIGMEEYDARDYKSQAQSYNNLLGRIVEYLVALDMEEEASKISGKGLEIPVYEETTIAKDGEEESVERVSGFDNADAQAIANKIKKDVSNEE